MSKWKSPVIVTDRKGAERMIWDAGEALHFLDNDWPTEPGYMHSRARKCCLAALEDPDRSGIAEMALRAAVTEIGMFPSGRTRR